MADEISVEKGKITEAQIEEVKAGKFCSIKKFAEEFGYSVAWITNLVQNKRIHAMKPTGGSWRIPASEVDRIRKEGIPPLPKKTPPPTAESEINIEGKHLDRVTPAGPAPVKKEQQGGVGWPLNILFK